MSKQKHARLWDRNIDGVMYIPLPVMKIESVNTNTAPSPMPRIWSTAEAMVEINGLCINVDAATHTVTHTITLGSQEDVDEVYRLLALDALRRVSDEPLEEPSE